MSHHHDHVLRDPLVDDPVLFKQLTTRPAVAWPTMTVLFVTVIPIMVLYVLAVIGTISPVWSGILAGCIGYFTFSSIHDGLHRSVSTINWVNETVCVATNFLIFPYLATDIIRWGHMQHHRFAGEEGKDPDLFIARNIWHVLTVGFIWDFYYVWRYFQHSSERPERELRKAKIRFVTGIALVVGIAVFLPPGAIIFWFLSSRIGLFTIALVFMYLPHQPHIVAQKDAPYQATIIRTGWDRFMTFFMAYQNWHLVHHLYPTVPFYRYKQVWKARAKFHESHRPARVSAFSLKPYDMQLPEGVQPIRH